ncbi:ABC transporter ATP-binding protein [Priestia taiwanensis]|uniref:Peptide ABC transporter ATP-binding protein n=1 Tax=Priestia taiwanensis TaxID=1347902 RepID=A0A917EUF9_9BACI|nr:oligopeptide/dipeptide ABC transporter ATP-binding protein [Priestia taiwanensis]MBM7365254.1 peptide/nickel transport system ATP-binding protein [Priestia taiwanensis]GGE85786.1 peptide ABC transporter ATP-binding protein [Priestia taiwanensis]
MSEPLLEVKNLKKYFPIKEGIFKRTTSHVKAVDDVSFTIGKGEAFGLVGESGSGKTTTGQTILRLTEKTEGEVWYKGQNLHDLSKEELRKLRPSMQLVFQDPYSSLNPRMRVGEAIGEALLEHKLATKEDVRDKVLEVMELCGLAPYHIDRYPHEFSGGQRQRIGIARAMALQPDFLVADEPVAALDVSIQAQIINLFSELKEKRGLSYLFISHDLSVVEHLCTKIGIMYLGSLVELAPRDELFANPLHPYTKALLSAVPIPDPTVKRERIILKGDIPSPANPPSGCRFHTRCPYATARCEEEVPAFRDLGQERYVACHIV